MLIEMETEEQNRRTKLLDNIAKSGAFFKSQQKNEADLTFDEKKRIAEDIYDCNRTLFLERFHKFMRVQDLCLFEDQRDIYEVDYYMKEVVKLNDATRNSTLIKNRRYEALQRLIQSGEYFKDSEMRKRNPLLFEQMIGRYLTESEKQQIDPVETPSTFSSFLIKTLDRDEENRTLKRQEDEEEAGWEESDSDEDCLEIKYENDSSAQVTEEEKTMLRQEFTNVMYERFLSGKEDYDYRSVDQNTEYDSCHLHQLDEEEKYFDAEDQ